MDQPGLKLVGYSEDGLLLVWRLMAIEDTAYSAWKVNGRSKEFRDEDLCFGPEMAVEVLEKFMG